MIQFVHCFWCFCQRKNWTKTYDLSSYSFLVIFLIFSSRSPQRRRRNRSTSQEVPNRYTERKRNESRYGILWVIENQKNFEIINGLFNHYKDFLTECLFFSSPIRRRRSRSRSHDRTRRRSPKTRNRSRSFSPSPKRSPPRRRNR